jgi:hypothetical protein
VDGPMPSRVEPVLRQTPWVVVCRGYVHAGMMSPPISWRHCFPA